MNSTDLTQKIYEQFNYLPYPESDIKESTKDNLELLFIHSIITPYYLRYQQTIDPQDKIINEQEQPIPVSNWSKDEWSKSFVSLHPLLKREKIKEDLLKSLQEYKPFEISRYIKLPATQPFLVETSLAACLLPLWEDSQPLEKIVSQWLKIQPLQLDTLQPKNEEIAFKEVTELLTKLELFLYILIEQKS